MPLTRRDLLKTSAAALPLSAWLDAARAGAQTPAKSTLKRAVLVSMLPKELSWHDRFALAKAVGFDGKAVRASREGKRATHGVNLPRAE